MAEPSDPKKKRNLNKTRNAAPAVGTAFLVLHILSVSQRRSDLVLFLLPYDDVLELVCRSDFSSALVYEGDMDVLANVLCERNRVDSIECP